MPYTDPATIHDPTVGGFPPSSWGDALNAAFAYVTTNKPHARVFNSVNFSHTSSGSFLPVTFDSERYDVGAMHSTVSNTSRLTVPTGEAGVYHIGACLQWFTNGVGRRLLKLRVNGTTDIAQVELPISTNESGGAIATDYALAAGDYVELHAFQSSGGTLAALFSANTSPEFWCRWVSI